MLTAIILTTAIVIAVIIYSLCKVSSKWSRIEESTEYARKWNEKWNYCDDECLHCEENDNCKFSEVKR